MKLRILYIIMLLFTLVAGVTYAWMDFSDIKKGNMIIYQYGSGTDYYIGVPSTEFEAELQLRNEAGEYEKATDMSFFNQVPSDMINLRFKFTNHSNEDAASDTVGAPITVNVYITGITASVLNEANKPKLSEAFFFAVTGSDGYPQNYTDVPERKLVSLESVLEPELNSAGGETGTYRAKLLENVVIPVATPARPEIGVYCYLLFDREADITYEDCDLTIGKILVTLA